MKKRFTILFLAVFLTFAFGSVAHAAMQDFWATVYKFDGKYNANGTIQTTKISTGITYQVLAHGSDTAETTYSYGTATAKTNPVTTTVFASDGGKVSFTCDPTDSTDDRYVDLIVVDTAGGYTLFLPHFDKYTHSIVIDERPNVMHHGAIWYAAATGENNTGVTFAADTMIHDVRTEVVTTATGTIDVGLLSSGTGGDANGFLASRVVSVAGYTADTGVVTNGSCIDYTAATTYGALLYTAITGSNSVASGGGKSYLGHIVTGSNTGVLTWTISTTTGSGAGYIHYWFTRLR